MRRSPLTSRSGSLVCPFCESGELEPTGRNSARCITCGRVTSRLILNTLRQLIALPECLGTHACECGHPEMRRRATQAGMAQAAKSRRPMSGFLPFLPYGSRVSRASGEASGEYCG
jgi:hypothetical protein